jgi:3-hydroxyacyl-[acyl-carrier-protein] dehydratase
VDWWTGLDRLVSLEPGKGARGLRNVPNTLSIFNSHFPRFPVLPGVLILGTLGDLAVLLVREQTGRGWRLAGLEQVRFRHFVRPGDQIELTVDLEELVAGAAILSGMARVEDRLVATVRRIRLVPHEEVAAR